MRIESKVAKGYTFNELQALAYFGEGRQNVSDVVRDLIIKLFESAARYRGQFGSDNVRLVVRASLSDAKGGGKSEEWRGECEEGRADKDARL